MSRPDTASLTPTEKPSGLDPITAMSVLDETTRANIIGTIVGHPNGIPSKKELEYYNPNVASSTLTDHLVRLEEVGLIEVVERDREGLERGQPYRFFQLTDAARELFDRNNLFEPDAYRELFAEVEKTDEIKPPKLSTVQTNETESDLGRTFCRRRVSVLRSDAGGSKGSRLENPPGRLVTGCFR